MNMPFGSAAGAAADAVRHGVSWWLAELAAMIPRRFVADTDSALAVLEVSTHETVLVLPGQPGALPARMAITAGDPGADRSAVAVAMQALATDEVVIRLDPSLVLETDVTLPRNAERSLRPILQHQLERLVPLPADEVAFEFRVVQVVPKAKTITVRLTVATHASIDDALAAARSLGLEPRRIVARSGRPDEPSVTLWRPTQPSRAVASRHRLRRMLEVAAVLLLATAYGAYVYRLNAVRDALEVQVAEATKGAAATRDLVRQQADTETALAILLEREREMGPLMLLNELTKLVPDSTWLSQLTARGRSVEIIGYSPRVNDLITRIQDNDLFFNPKFLSPTTMSPDGKGERFDVSFEVWVKGAP